MGKWVVFCLFVYNMWYTKTLIFEEKKYIVEVISAKMYTYVWYNFLF